MIPMLSLFQPAVVEGGSLLTIIGNGLVPIGATEGTQTTDVVVWVDKAPCVDVTVVNTTATETLQCTVTDYITGLYPVHVFVSGKGYASVAPEPISDLTDTFDISPVLVVSLQATVGNISPNSGSTAGGTTVAVTGTGFSHIPEDLSVAIGGIPCEVVSSTRSEITCITGASSATEFDVSIAVNGYQITNSLRYTYDLAKTPLITTVDGGMDILPGELIMISGEGFGSDISEVEIQVVPVGQEFDFSSTDAADMCTVNTVSDNTIDCTVPSQPAGTYTLRVHVSELGLALGDATINYLLAISSFSPSLSGYGGGITLTVTGEGFPQSADTISVTVCENECSIMTSTLTELECVLSPHYSDIPLDDTTNCSVKVTYEGLEVLAQQNFQFLADRTPTIDSISPATGGTAGGTIVTITGTGLLPPGSDPLTLLEQDIVVTIDGALCEWFGRTTLPSDSSIECRTSEHSTTLLGEVSIHVAAKGFALATGGVDGVLFEYVDRWSSPFTWGGGPLPINGDSVYIKSGQTVFLDVDTAILNLVLIEGSLIFEDEGDLHLQAKYIFINHGKLQVRLLSCFHLRLPSPYTSLLPSLHSICLSQLTFFYSPSFSPSFLLCSPTRVFRSVQRCNHSCTKLLSPSTAVSVTPKYQFMGQR